MTLAIERLARGTASEAILAWLAGSMVPVDDTVLVMVPVDTVWTVVVVVISGAALELLVASQVPTPAAATTTSTAPAIVPLRLNHFLRSAATYASLVFAHRVHWVCAAPRQHASTAGPRWRNHPIGSTYTPGNNHL